jgi:ankyrin repeat protein
MGESYSIMGWLRRLFGLPKGGEGGNPMLALRSQALSLRRSEAGMAAPPPDAPIWGVLMETGFDGGSATLLALSDGTTSLYLSSGGGMLGGQAHDRVRKANAGLLRSANEARSRLTPTRAFPLPAKGQVFFYALTDAGVLTATAREPELAQGAHALSALFMAGHGVITELRRIQQGTPDERPEPDPNHVIENTGGLTVLMMAGYTGQREVLQRLIRAGGDVEIQDERGLTALMLAGKAGQAACVAELIAAGAEVNRQDKEGSTALMFAAQHGHDEALKLLLEAGADPEIVGRHGFSAIRLAQQNRLPETLRLLTTHPRKSP